MKFEIQFYRKSNRNQILDFILSLDEEAKLDILALLRKMEEDPFSLGSLSKKVKSVKNLFELRVRARGITIRFFYCYKKNKIIIILHGFVKKSKQIPAKELETAIKRKKEVENE
jgi:phage-related protein